MTHSLLRAGALSCALLASTCLTVPALAQGGAPTPPVYQHVDANGVDVTDGSFHFSLVEASVGAGAGEMALATSWGTHRGDNFNRMLHRSVASGTAHFAIVIGNRSRTFSGPATGSSFASDQAAGETLARIGPSQYRYTEADGTVTEFGQPSYGGTLPMNELCASGNETSCRLLGLSTTAPNGAALSYDWHVEERCWDEFDGLSQTTVQRCGVFHRLAGVANNAGTAINYNYSETDFPGQPQPGWYRREGATLSTPAGGTASAAYSFVSDRITDVTDMGGRTWRLTTDISNRLIGIRRPGSASDDVTIAYGANGVSSVTRDGITTSYARTVAGSLGTTVVTDALGRQRTIVSNLAIGRPTQIADELQRTTLIAYDTAGRVAQVTRPQGNELRLSYDARGNVVESRAVARPGSGDADIVAAAAFPASCANAVTCNRPTSTTDPRGHTTDYTYDPVHGGVLSVTAPAPSPGAVRPQTRVAYAQVSGVTLPTETSACQTQASCTGTADEVRTVVAFNADLSTASVTTRDGTNTLSATATNSYDSIGNLAAVDGPLAGTDDTVRFRYDSARQRTGTISPDPDGAGPRKRRAERVAYRPDGQASAVETGTVEGTSDADWAAFAPLERAETRFIGAYPVSSRLIAGGSTRALTVLGYDPLGRIECTAQRMDPNLFATDTDACVQNSQNGTPDRITKSIRDPAGQVTEVRTAVGTALEAPEVRTTYTLNGQVESLTDAEFNHTVYFFDGHDRLRRTQYPVWQRGAGASNPAHYDERTYDPAGNVATFRNRAGEVTSFSYDNLNRLTLRDRPAGSTELDTTYGYDLLGRMTRATTNYSLTFAYDALGRRLSETSPHGTIASQHDLAGRRTRLTYPDGFFVAYDYAVTGETTRIRENGATSGIGVLATFGYDDLGRRTSLTRGNGIVTSYSYDPASRLQTLAHNFGGNGNDVTLTFGHNAASQITSRSGMHNAYAFTSSVAGIRTDTHNGRNEIATVNGTSVTHDLRGNLTNDGSRSFAYTSDNLMTQAGGASLFYDPLDRLRFVQGGGNEQRVYDGQDLILELDMNGTSLLRRYVHGPGVDEPLVWYEGSGTSDRRWLTADERGSIIGAFNDAGSGLGYVAYDEYGRRQVWGNPGRFGFTGQQWLPEIGMYYFRARMLDPDGGRFMQTDPIGYGDGMNLYAYVGGDPINGRDPSGTKCTQATGSRICLEHMSAESAQMVAAEFGIPWTESGGGSHTAYVCVRYCNAPPAHTEPSGEMVVHAPPQMAWVPVRSATIEVDVVRYWGFQASRLEGEPLFPPCDPDVVCATLPPIIPSARFARLGNLGQVRSVTVRYSPPRAPTRAQTIERGPQLSREMQFQRDLRGGTGRAWQDLLDAAAEALGEFMKR